MDRLKAVEVFLRVATRYVPAAVRRVIDFLAARFGPRLYWDGELKGAPQRTEKKETTT